MLIIVMMYSARHGQVFMFVQRSLLKESNKGLMPYSVYKITLGHLENKTKEPYRAKTRVSSFPQDLASLEQYHSMLPLSPSSGNNVQRSAMSSSKILARRDRFQVKIKSS